MFYNSRQGAPMPTQSTLIPSLRYRDAHAAIAWLIHAFGFTPQAVFDGPNNTIAHAQLTLNGGMIMLGSASNTGGWSEHMVQPDEIGGKATQATYVVVADCTAAYEQAKAAGAPIIGELREMDYGGKAFSCRDLEGHFWSFGEYDPWM
jgi:uncharacterized glyoxalase superfamily protein PhnB